MRARHLCIFVAQVLVVLPAHADEGTTRHLPAATVAALRAGTLAVRGARAAGPESCCDDGGCGLQLHVGDAWLGTRHCEDDLRALRARAPRRALVGRTFRVDQRLGNLEHAGRTLYSTDRAICFGPTAETYCTDFAEVTVDVLSLVGPILSFGVFDEAAGAHGNPYGTERWRAIDVRDGRPADLATLVDEPSLLAALRRNGRLLHRGREAKHRLTTARTFAAVRADLIRDGSLDPDAGFALVDYDATTDTVGVELPMQTECHDVLIDEIDVRAHPTPQLRAWLLAAQRGDGHLLASGPLPTVPRPTEPEPTG